MTDGGFDGGGHGLDGHGGFDGSGFGHFDGHGIHGVFDGVYDGLDFGHSGDGHSTFDALVVSHSFCGHHSHSADIDSSVDIGHAHFGGHGNLAAIGATFSGVLDPSKEAFGVSVSGHCYIDLIGVVTAALRSRQLMELYTPLGARKRIQPTNFVGILPKRAATTTMPAVMPNGYYPGTTGLTTQWRSFWQLGKQTFCDKLAGKPLGLDSKRRWNIDVSITQWYFSEADDYETQILANVWSPHMGRNLNSQDRLEQLVIARGFIREMAELLGRCSPTASSSQYRRRFAQ
jgi:hypothetical protein